MTSPFVLEGGLGIVMLVVFVAGLFAGDDGRRAVGWLATAGILLLTVASLFLTPVASPPGAPFVQDGLALFAKRLFLVATFISLLGGLSLPGVPFARRALEYHLLILSSLLGMLVLASARDVILLFVAFELMSIPLYVLSGFVKRDAAAGESALKFFLVGSVSSAVMAYGLSFVYGATGTSLLAGMAGGARGGDPLLLLGLLLTFAGFAFKIAAFPFHMWVPDTYEAASTPFVAWLSVAPKAAGFVAILRVYVEGIGDRVAWLVPMAAGLAALTVIAGNLMALPQQNAKRLLAYSGIAHIGYMLIGLAADSTSGAAMVLFYLVAYVFGNMGAFLVVEAVYRAEGSERLSAFSGLAQRSPVLALSMLLFLLSLGGVPFVAGFWAKLYVFWAAAERGLYWLVLLGAVLTVVALFYYLVVAKRMYVDAPTRPERVPVAPTLIVAVALCVLGVVAIGVYPRAVVAAAFQVARPLF
jgi:NADH-quinone oxidoreductase subunit N